MSFLSRLFGMDAPAATIKPQLIVPPVSDDSQILSATVDLIAKFEGFVPTPYLCPAKVWTIGFGSTRDGAGVPVTSTSPAINVATAREWAMRDLMTALAAVRSSVSVAMTINEQVALVDFVYNLGAGNFARSNILRDLNAGRLSAAADDLMQWNHASGVVLAGLTRRRAAERDLMLS